MFVFDSLETDIKNFRISTRVRELFCVIFKWLDILYRAISGDILT